ncbi:uncharacterized protein LOC110997598 [Pieris rapae]|uniref:uncharacterized protein LOC110997598 n=1 Tax=Pieris rapae TaxID=64459 RepID=UPI000B92A181|nr:uncharacterized protein LOC110997598 [Pieris rapae]
MESPPSFSTHSEAPPLSEDSGLLITSGSFSSDSASGWHHITSELQESDFDERSLSLCESTDASERICGDFFNTVKKGPGKVIVTAIEPPPEFQDNPVPTDLECTTTTFVGTPNKCLAVCVPPSVICTNDSIIKPKSSSLNIPVTAGHISPMYPRKFKAETLYDRRQCLNHRFASPRLLHLSPCRGTRPSSRNSLSSRLSSSHNSLITQFQTDDSSFITQAISHDTLSAKTSDITDMYNVPFDSDIYAVPIDMIRPNHSNIRARSKRPQRTNKRRSKTTTLILNTNNTINERNYKPKDTKHKDTKTKRHSLPGSSCRKKILAESDTDSLHLTLREMRKYLHTLYSSSSDSECRNTINKKNGSLLTTATVHSRQALKESSTAVFLKESNEPKTAETNNNHKKTNKNTAEMNVKSKKHKEIKQKECSIIELDTKKKGNQGSKVKMSPVRILSMNIKQSFCNLFRWRRSSDGDGVEKIGRGSPPPAVRRALPPLPQSPHPSNSRRSANEDDTVMDFATSIQKVKDYGWYWGPISVESAEKILSNEPDGSFIVRDSSDDHYIFTLTFKLNGLRHVRIEHDQGNFSFGGCTMFKAQTIVEFIENAVETSRSGRYLFFLNLRPVLGPVRVQLLYPVSRFKRVQSLQHMCRFVILKQVRRDLVTSLPLPRRLLDYLNATHYYSELLADL